MRLQKLCIARCGKIAPNAVENVYFGEARPAYLRRLADVQLEALLRELPAVLITGPRAAGKTTTARTRAVHPHRQR